MARSGRAPASFAEALRDYVEARSAAIHTARLALNISEMDARALLFIVDRPGAQPRELKDHLGISSAGVTTLADRLINRELIRRESDDRDRRIVHLHATVDIANEPWSALNRFDTTISDAIAAADQDRAASAAEFLAELTRSSSHH